MTILTSIYNIYFVSINVSLTIKRFTRETILNKHETKEKLHFNGDY